MRPGSAGFVGKRLREAREARGVSGPALAEMLGVSRQSVSQYETSASTPHPAVVERLVEILNVPRRFFFSVPERNEPETVFFRSMSSATKAARVRSLSKYAWLKELVVFLGEFVDFPEAAIPQWEGNPFSFGTREIEEAATTARAALGLADLPVPHVVRVLENHGAIVSRIPLEADTLDAFSEWDIGLGRPIVILGSDKGSFTRSRFDAAHELGHMVLHRGINRNQLNSTTEFSLLEKQAHRFAAAFLLPARAFLEDFIVPALSAFEALGEKWLVSVASLIHRSGDLGLVSERELRRLWMAASRRGLRLRDPLDDRLDPEQPRLLLESFNLLIDNKIISRAGVLRALAFSADDLAAVASLPDGFFAEDTGERPVIRLRPREREDTRSSEDAPTAPGEVVQFSTASICGWIC